MLGINMDDVMVTLGLMKNHLTALAVCFALAVIVTIAAARIPKPKKGFVRGTSWIAFLLAAVVIVNMILTGPVSDMLNLVFSEAGEISQKSIDEASALCEQISEEGFVLLKNDGILPLSKDAKINTFGWSSTNPIYGGTGSGSLSGLYERVSLLDGLANAGLAYNTDLTDFYTGWRADRPAVEVLGQNWTVPEPTMDEYEAAGIFENAQAYSDTAMIVISRSGGEGADLPTTLDASLETYTESGGIGGAFGSSSGTKFSEYAEDLDPDRHYLELSSREVSMVERVAGEFENVIVVLNAANPFEMGWVDEYPSIKAVILAPTPGQTGFNALGRILTGEVNPSGRTIDTYVYDIKETPSFRNFGSFTYTNAEEFFVEGSIFTPATQPTFINYVEGIYVGYRFYETAAQEGLIDYDSTVQYPFGYGLSYTDFTRTLGTPSVTDTTVSVDVTVTNNGSVAGKDVVELYVTPPYTNGGIEKASVNLAAFDKTEELQPGESQTVTLSFEKEDIASFDTYGEGCYVLEQGEYEVSLRSDSHTVIDSFSFTEDSTTVYDENNARNTDQTAAAVRFDYAEGDVTYLSRADGFANYEEATAEPSGTEMSDEAKDGFYNQSNYDPTQFNNSDDTVPVTGANNGLQLVDLRGADYEDAQWEALLDQLTVEDMVNLIGLGGYQSPAAASVGKTQQVDCDGPASINNNFTGGASIGFPAGVVIAATWNTDLAHAFGASIGKMADEMNVAGWYAPAMNIHRNAFAGRNFEYYSEDGLISGKMASQAILGASESGVYSFMKHFAMNDQETNRACMLCTWSNEQAIREIYLKPFEISVKEGHCTAVMSAFNYIGNKWCSANPELLNSVLRDEWGFRGMVLTDYFAGYGYQDADLAIRNGDDFCLTPQMTEYSEMTDKTSATSLQAMRRACKNILYTVVNSRDYEEGNYAGGMPGWQKVLIGADVLIAALLLALELLLFRNYKKKASGK